MCPCLLRCPVRKRGVCEVRRILKFGDNTRSERGWGVGVRKEFFHAQLLAAFDVIFEARCSSSSCPRQRIDCPGASLWLSPFCSPHPSFNPETKAGVATTTRRYESCPRRRKRAQVGEEGKSSLGGCLASCTSIQWGCCAKVSSKTFREISEYLACNAVRRQWYERRHGMWSAHVRVQTFGSNKPSHLVFRCNSLWGGIARSLENKALSSRPVPRAPGFRPKLRI